MSHWPRISSMDLLRREFLADEIKAGKKTRAQRAREYRERKRMEAENVE